MLIDHAVASAFAIRAFAAAETPRITGGRHADCSAPITHGDVPLNDSCVAAFSSGRCAAWACSFRKVTTSSSLNPVGTPHIILSRCGNICKEDCLHTTGHPPVTYVRVIHSGASAREKGDRLKVPF